MSEPPGADQLWRLAGENSPVGLTVVTPDGLIQLANRALCAMLRCEEPGLLGQSFRTITHPDDLPQHVALFEEALAGTRTGYRLTKRCLRSDGSTLWGDLSVTLLRDDEGEPLYFIGQIVDVTSQRQHAEELADALGVIEHQRRTSQAILDTVDVGLLLIDQDGHYEQYNRRHHDFLELAFPDGHGGQAGQLGAVYAADGETPLGQENMPSTRAAAGEEFDDFRIWVGPDPLSRRALAVSARSVRDRAGDFAGAAMAYSDVTDIMRAVRTREDFLAAVSHELRTPLTSVLGHLEMLVDHGDLDTTAAEQVQVVRRNALRLRDLVSDLLDSAQLRAGAVLISREVVDVARLVTDAAESAVPAATAAGLELVVEVPSSAAARVDPQRVRQVVDNLCSNAVKYTDPGGRVALSLVATRDEVLLRVCDTGIGIDAADLQRLFTPFFRADPARDRLVPGVGLGLGIAQAIAQAHGGRIDVESTAGQGASFTLRLPRGEGVAEEPGAGG